MAKQAPLPLHPETTTPPDAFGRDQRTERRHNRAARRKSKEIDKKRWLRKLSAKSSRDMREMTMPDPRAITPIEERPDVLAARKRYQRYCAILEGREPWLQLEQLIERAWGHAGDLDDLAKVLACTDVGHFLIGDIVALKHDVYEFGLWLILKADDLGFSLVAVDIPPYDADDPENEDPMDIKLKGHACFEEKRALADVAIELPTSFVTNLFTRVGWAKPFELDDALLRRGQTRSSCPFMDVPEEQQAHLQTLLKMWEVRQERCIRMAF